MQKRGFWVSLLEIERAASVNAVERHGICFRRFGGCSCGAEVGHDREREVDSDAVL
jgi:hypothetical protein